MAYADREQTGSRMVAIIVGVGTVIYFTMAHETIAKLFPDLPEVMRDLNVGTVAFVLNIIGLVVVSSLTQTRARAARTAP